MGTIIMESVLFVALIAAGCALLVYAVLQFTPFGRRVRQTSNRRRIERDAERVCPIHGMHEEHEMVRLPSGDLLCPRCYEEISNGRLDQ